jgi:hypothetical protein
MLSFINGAKQGIIFIGNFSPSQMFHGITLANEESALIIYL